MKFRFTGHFAPADLASLANAVIGILAISISLKDPFLASRLILLSALIDGVDGIIARKFGGSEIGPHLDSLADIVSFGVAPIMIIYGIHAQTTSPIIDVSFNSFSIVSILVVSCIILFFSMSMIRLSLYMTQDVKHNHTIGSQTTLSAILICSAILTQNFNIIFLLILTLLLSYMMVSSIIYPDLLFRDALLLGIILSLTIIFPNVFGRAFPYALLILSLAYLVLSPSYYWRILSERI
tara:strand:+ start:815 stop:1528 length:714 start_codon:yes stop_codon:yes gene_type:complete